MNLQKGLMGDSPHGLIIDPSKGRISNPSKGLNGDLPKRSS